MLVDDDELYREVMLDALVDHGFAVRGVPDALSLLAACDMAAQAQVLLLDWTLPEMSGIELLSRLRRRGLEVPVVFLTGQATPERELLAFDNGAADFIEKARGAGVIAKRLAHVIETSLTLQPRQHDIPWVCGELMLRSQTGRAEWRERDVGLTLGEYNVVHLLASNAGNTVTYRAIYDRARYAGYVAARGGLGYLRNVRSSIKRIRKKFTAIDLAFAEIGSAPNVGYFWRAPGDSPTAA